MSDPFTIDAAPTSTAGRLQRWLRGRRLMIAALLALAEVVWFLVWRPSGLLMATLATVLLVVCAMGASRIGPGLGRDLLWIVAIAQGIVVAIPLVIGVSVVAALVTGAVIIAALVLVAMRWRT